jgi:hypothetical protein
MSASRPVYLGIADTMLRCGKKSRSAIKKLAN